MKVSSSFCIALLFGLILTPFASADNLATETFTSTFNPDPRFTDRGNGYVSSDATVEVFNLTGDTDEVRLNLETWPETNGTYSGAVFQESVLALDYVGVEKEDALPFSYVTLGSVHSWTSKDLMNGAVKTNVRLPWVGDNYDFMSMRIYKVNQSDTISFGTQVSINGTVPLVSGGQTELVYENYLNFDMWNWSLGDIFETSFMPDDLHTWPFRIDPVEGYYTENELTPGIGPFPYSWISRYSSFSMEQIGDRYYADVNLFLEPGQEYYFTTSAIISSNSKPEIALSSESINGGNNNCTILQGVYTDSEQKFEKLDQLPRIELGWSMLFQGGHGDGLTGLEVEGDYFQSIEFMAELDPREEGENFSLMLPIIPDNQEKFDYSIEILAFDSTGRKLDWIHATDSSNTIQDHQDGDLYITVSPLTNNTLTSEGFILYSPRCEVTLGPDAQTMAPCVPEVGAEYYYIKIWLNYDLAETPKNYRLLGSEGNKGFMVATNDYSLLDLTGNLCPSASDTCLALRNGGDYYGYNLTLFAQHHNGSWVQIDGDSQIISYQQLETKEIGQKVAFSEITNVVNLIGSKGTNEVDLWEQASIYWNEFDFLDPRTYGNLAKAIMTTVTAAVRELWIGTSELIGTLQNAFSNTADYLLELGSFVKLYLGKIADVVINIVVQIYDFIVPLTTYMIALAGAWVFYFGLRLILLVISYIHISLKGGAFR